MFKLQKNMFSITAQNFSHTSVADEPKVNSLSATVLLGT